MSENTRKHRTLDDPVEDKSDLDEELEAMEEASQQSYPIDEEDDEEYEEDDGPLFSFSPSALKTTFLSVAAVLLLFGAVGYVSYRSALRRLNEPEQTASTQPTSAPSGSTQNNILTPYLPDDHFEASPDSSSTPETPSATSPEEREASSGRPSSNEGARDSDPVSVSAETNNTPSATSRPAAISREDQYRSYVGKTKDDLSSYASSNNIVVSYDYEISDLPEGTIISIIESDNGLKAVVSSGSSITLPSLAGLSQREATQWLSTNNLEYKVTKCYNDAAIDTVYMTSPFANSSVRKNSLVKVYVSDGNLIMSDMRGSKREDMEAFINRASAGCLNILANYTYAYDDRPAGQIVSVERGGANAIGTNVKNGHEFDVVISRGPEVNALNMSGWTRGEAEEWCRKFGIVGIFKEVYNESVPTGQVMSNSPTSGGMTRGKTMEITVSLGKFVAPDYVGKDYYLLENAVSNAALRGAPVRLIMTEEFNDTVPSGCVISQEQSGNNIYMTVSLGRRP